ncbi:hypothetical protein HYV82_00720 [Candidatus Woesearchaeota archaeon]|nr:hypothetical protein [Candidatus Woesearchaeota archaeon]
MRKRGVIVLPLYAAIGLLVSAMIVFTLVGFIVRATGMDTTLARNYVARDLALLLDTIYAGNGDTEYFYNMPERFDISIKDNLVTVRSKTAKFESSHYFATSDKFTELKFEPEAPPRALIISKKAGTITIKGVYDENEKEAMASFEEFIQFINANKDTHYDFRCREEYELSLDRGYYVVVDRKGEAALFYDTGTRTTELMTAKAADFKHITTGTRMDFFVTSKDWTPGIAIRKSFTEKVIIVNDEKTSTWMWGMPAIDINELPRCEAQELARRRR